jgi:Na+-driven multidrug efflux pump
MSMSEDIPERWRMRVSPRSGWVAYAALHAGARAIISDVKPAVRYQLRYWSVFLPLVTVFGALTFVIRPEASWTRTVIFVIFGAAWCALLLIGMRRFRRRHSNPERGLY